MHKRGARGSRRFKRKRFHKRKSYSGRKQYRRSRQRGGRRRFGYRRRFKRGSKLTKKIMRIVSQGEYKTYHRDTYYLDWASSGVGTNAHMALLMSKQQEYLWFAQNHIMDAGQKTNYQYRMKYAMYHYYFKNNQQTANDYWVWTGRVKKDIPSFFENGLVGYQSCENVVEWMTQILKQQTWNSTTNGDTKMFNQMDFSPKDAWLSKQYVRWGKPKFMRVAPGQRFSIKMRVGYMGGNLTTKFLDHGDGQDIPTSGTGAETTGPGISASILAKRGDRIFWIMTRGTIGNQAANNSGHSTVLPSKTEIIVATRGAYSFSATEANTNLLITQNLPTDSAYGVNYNNSTYQT